MTRPEAGAEEKPVLESREADEAESEVEAEVENGENVEASARLCTVCTMAHALYGHQHSAWLAHSTTHRRALCENDRREKVCIESMMKFTLMRRKFRYVLQSSDYIESEKYLVKTMTLCSSTFLV